ncbi:hypothetical protein LSTR_LSTR009820 [Laodelphax striatellus]|uniref:WW domain-containing oxidoreductase n=1 Tax=Laodelphax striatellus TaxID=195883 RepID=A0A482WIT5_LAOST|nr:hypothetical protein LSTR_LSTR009820 [Laodelphax striatellus]
MAGILPDSDSEDELPPGWEERATVDGCVYYVNHLTKGTQWTHPRTGKKKRVNGELPFGWIKVVDAECKIIYKDQESGRTTYTDPRLAFAEEEKEFPMDLRQRFDCSSTARQVLHGQDLNGKVAIVTGANCGIGFETARALALHGCLVIFACRSMERAQAAIDKIKQERSAAKCLAFELDLQSLASVKLFADQFKRRFKFANLKLDSLDENALSPSSASWYWGMMAYNNSKLCNVLFANELAERWKTKGICVYSLHPGNMVSSYISRNWWFYRVLFAFVRPFTKSLEQAASCSVYCATANELGGITGLYVNNCFPCKPSEAASNAELSGKLWTLSCDVIKRILPDNNDLE